MTQGQDELRFNIEAIRIKNILPFLGIDEYPIEGTVWANGVLRGRVEPDQELLPTISGKIKILTKEGIIHAEATLAKILSLVNFPSIIAGDLEFDQDNIPFDSITADIRCNKRHVFIQKIMFSRARLFCYQAVGRLRPYLQTKWILWSR